MSEGPRISQVTLVVESTAASADFYRRLGLAVPDEAGVHVEIALDAAPISLELDAAESAGLWNASWRTPEGGARVIIGVAVPDRATVDGLYADLTGAGHPGVQPPFDAFWGGRYAIVADPDGNQVGLMSPNDQERAFWPPTPSPDL